MKNYSSREILDILRRDGWYYVRSNGDDHFYKHPTKRGFVTVPHPKKSLPPKTASVIFKNAELKDMLG